MVSQVKSCSAVLVLGSLFTLGCHGYPHLIPSERFGNQGMPTPAYSGPSTVFTNDVPGVIVEQGESVEVIPTPADGESSSSN